MAPQKMSSLQIWVEEFGGPVRLAETLGITSHAVRQWMRRQAWPRTEYLVDLVTLSRGKLTYESIIESSRPPSRIKRTKIPLAPKRPKRISAALLTQDD